MENDPLPVEGDRGQDQAGDQHQGEQHRAVEYVGGASLMVGEHQGEDIEVDGQASQGQSPGETGGLDHGEIQQPEADEDQPPKADGGAQLGETLRPVVIDKATLHGGRVKLAGPTCGVVLRVLHRFHMAPQSGLWFAVRFFPKPYV